MTGASSATGVAAGMPREGRECLDVGRPFIDADHVARIGPIFLGTRLS